MRRKIERTLTIITTTTWTISWQEDMFLSDLRPDSAMDDSPRPDLSEEIAQELRQFSATSEAKEVNKEKREKVMNPVADQPPDDPDFYQSKKGNEKL